MGTHPQSCHWQLNDFLLKQSETRYKLGKAIEHYFIDNQPSVMSMSVLWETHKAVIRGEYIGASSRLKRRRRETREKLTNAELRLQTSNTLTQLRRVTLLREALKDLNVGKIAKAMQTLRHYYYKKGNKADALLANALRDHPPAWNSGTQVRTGQIDIPPHRHG